MVKSFMAWRKKSQVDERDCDEYSGVILNNLGLIHERYGNLVLFTCPLRKLKILLD